MRPYPKIQLRIGGEWRTRPGQPIHNPLDDSVLGELPHATPQDMADALEAARHGHRAWRRTAPGARAEIMRRATTLLRERAEEIATSITQEQGKPLGRRSSRCCAAATSSNGMPRKAAALWPRHPRRARHAPHRAARADRHRRRLLALELPDQLADPQGGGRAGGGLRDHPQGLRGDARRGLAPGARLRRCRRAGRCAEPAVRRALAGVGGADPGTRHPARDLHRLGVPWASGSPRWRGRI